jgi:hypothetical protein
MDEITAMIIGSLAMIAIIALGIIILKIEDQEGNKKGIGKSRNNSYVDIYLRKVQKNRKLPRKIHDSEISPYQGFGGKKQMQRAQSRKKTQIRRKESSIWDNLAPKEYHTTLNIVIGTIFIITLLIVST